MISHSLTGTVLMTAATGRVNEPIAVELHYDPDTDPFAVQMVLVGADEDGSSDVVWFFARELMYQGVAARGVFGVGKGDVKFKAEIPHARLVACISNPTGHADIALPLADVTQFLDKTCKAVPIGEEQVDESEVDDLLKEILG